MRRFLPFIIVLVILPLYLLSLKSAAEGEKALSKNKDVTYVIPSPIIKLTSAEFDGLSSDFLFLKVLTFYGETLSRTQRPRVNKVEWLWMLDELDVATDLDPWFLDPYYFANANFPWEAGLAKETNDLLAKGNRYRQWDWMIPFFMGFNEFYFLHNPAKASELFMQGAKRPDAESILLSLSVRMAYKASRTQVAIDFLHATLNETKDPLIQRELKLRLKTLEGVSTIEKGIAAFNSKFGRNPSDVEELKQKKVIAEIPEDPYGGKFYIDKDGMVKTTSNLFVVTRK